MDVFIPILLGVFINLLVYAIGLKVLKNPQTASVVLFASTGLTVIASFIVGGFAGMGIIVIALGMLLAAVFFSILNLIRTRAV